MNDNGKLFVGLLAGLGLGTILGILIAPEKGSDTYRKIEKAVKDAANDLLDMGDETAREAEKKVSRTSSSTVRSDN